MPLASRPRTVLGYALMLGATAVLYLVVRHLGEGLTAPLGEAVGAAPAGPEPAAGFAHVLLALVVIIAAARVLGTLFRRLHQPPVIGEVIAGILLGPSLLGHIAPAVSAFVLPPSVGPPLAVIAQVGVILFMFLVGLELDTRLLRERSHATVAISHASIVVPFAAGSILALWLYPLLSSPAVGFTNFSLFMGISMSVTAFPVLARILTDHGIQRTRLGVIALACAAVDDVTAWCLLALVVGVVRATTSSSLATLGLTALYVVAMLVVVRPPLVRFVRRQDAIGTLRQGATAVLLVGLLVSALATESIGIHALFGAFLFGALVPHDGMVARELARRLEDFVVVLLLPAFFAFTGMRTQIGLLDGVGDWLICAVIIAVACLGKFGGSAVAARASGLPLRESAALGLLMNTRGLMELIVLNVGLDLGVISPRLFAMMVIMTVVTTLMTTPLLHLLYRGQSMAEALGDSARA